MKYIGSFCLFWWDFIVGDSLTLAVGSGLAILGAALFAHAGANTAAEVVLPGAVLATLALSLVKR